MNDGTKIEVSFNNDVTNLNKLKQYEERLQNIYSFIKALENPKSNEAISKLESTMKQATTETKKTTKEAKTLGDTFKTMFKIGSIVAFSRAIMSLTSSMAKLSQKSVEYIENVNLLEVAYKNANESIEQSSKRIEDYIDKMAGVYGLDESRLTRQFGIFKQLANAMQLPTETAEHLSEIMVKMTNDIASLYNLPLNRASNALQSALAGQVRPIRSATGADITEKTLQNTVADLGLDRTISDLSYVEKRLVMVVSLTNQLKNSQGDYARTIESASNQIRVMHDQWDRLSRAVGNVFYPILEGILPYLNAILMVLTEIFNMIASLVGFKMPEFDYSGLTGVSDLAMDIEDELGGAGEATDALASKLKGLRSFDKLNVINTPKDTNKNTSGGVGSGYVDPKILSAFNSAFSNYNDMMDKVQMKASKIKEDIMKWLGFTKQINPLTGETYYKYEGIGKTLGNLYNAFKKLSPMMKAIVGYVTYLAGSKVISAITKIVTLLSKTKLGQALVFAGTQLKTMVGYMNVYKSTASGMLTGIDVWQKEATGVDKLKTSLVGAGGLVAGLLLTHDAFKKISEEGANLSNILEGVGGLLSTTLGGVMIGASIGGGTGAIIGGISGAVLSLVDAILSYKSASEIYVEQYEKEADASQKVYDSYIARKEAMEAEMNQSLAVSTYHLRLIDELEGMIDANGQLKAGYEDRAEFILTTLNEAYGTEYTLLDLQSGKYKEIKQNINDVIEKERARIILQANEKIYLEALENEMTAWHNYDEATKERNRLNEQYNDILDEMAYMESVQGTELWRNYEYTSKLNGQVYKGYWAYSKMKDELKATDKALGEQQKVVQNTQAVWNGYAKDIKYYEELQTAILTENKEEQNRLIDEHMNKIKTEDGVYQASTSDRIKYLKDAKQQTIDIYKEAGQEITDAQLHSYEVQAQNLAEALANETQTVKDVTPDIVDGWGALAKLSETAFMDNFKKLPRDIQDEIISEMEAKGYSISSELQKGIDSLKPTVNFKANTDNLTTGLNGWINRNQSLLFGKGNTQINLGSNGGMAFIDRWATYAGGGLPQVGQIFVANEKGPELIDEIGGQSFVANQKQIGEFMDERYGKYSQPVNVTIPVSVGGEQLGTIVLNNLQELAKSNGSAITIG